MSLELIARLNPKSIDILSAGGGRAHQHLVPEDIAAALSRCSHPLGSQLLRYIGAGEGQDALCRDWVAHALDIAKAEGWKSKKPETMVNLALSVLAEHIDLRCKPCSGRGWLYAEDAARSGKPSSRTSSIGGKAVLGCKACDTLGVGKASGRQRARDLRISEPSYVESWVPRYEHLHTVLSDIRNEATAQFKSGLRDGRSRSPGRLNG